MLSDVTWIEKLETSSSFVFDAEDNGRTIKVLMSQGTQENQKINQ